MVDRFSRVAHMPFPRIAHGEKYVWKIKKICSLTVVIFRSTTYQT